MKTAKTSRSRAALASLSLGSLDYSQPCPWAYPDADDCVVETADLGEEFHGLISDVSSRIFQFIFVPMNI